MSDGEAEMERMMGLEPMGSTLGTLRTSRYATPACWLLTCVTLADLSLIRGMHGLLC